MRKLTAALIFLWGLSLSGAANATLFNFDYAYSSDSSVVTGMFTGDLQGDGDTILNITDMVWSYLGVDYAFGGMWPAGPDRWDIASISGTNMQLGAWSPPGAASANIVFLSGVYGSDAFIRAANDTTVLQVGPINLDAWSVSAKAPAPASIVLLGLGLVGLGFTRRKKA